MAFTKQQPTYTITEAIKVFDLALANSTQARGAAFWKKVEDNQLLPKRTCESMRSFWKQNANEGLEIYLREAISKQIRYCHGFSEIPQVCLG